MSLILIGGCVVLAVGMMSAWALIRRTVRTSERRARDEALAAATRSDQAWAASRRQAAAQPDPCAPGLSDRQRVRAMRALLQRGNGTAAAAATSVHVQADSGDRMAATEPAVDDEGMTTTPMAWKPTLPPDEAQAIHERQARLQRSQAPTEAVLLP
jgi:hypothetical protein